MGSVTHSIRDSETVADGCRQYDFGMPRTWLVTYASTKLLSCDRISRIDLENDATDTGKLILDIQVSVFFGASDIGVGTIVR